MRIDDTQAKPAASGVPSEQPAPQHNPSGGTNPMQFQFGKGFMSTLGGLATGQNTEASYNEFKSHVATVTGNLAKYGIDLRCSLSLNSKVGTTDLAYDTIIMAARMGDLIAVYTYVIQDNSRVFPSVEVHVTQYDANLQATNYDDSVFIERVASEAYDDEFTAIITREVATLYQNAAQGKTGVTVLPSKVWYTSEISTERMKEEINYGLENLMQTLMPSYASEETCKTLKSLKTNGGNGLDVRLGGFFANDAAATMEDELGRVTSPTVSVAVTALTNVSSEGNSMHRGNASAPIGTAMVRTDVVFVGSPYLPPGVAPQFFTPGQVNANCFAPIVIVEDIKEKAPSIEDLLLTLGATYSVLNPEVIRSSFDPSTMGVLNIATNLLGDADPTPFTSGTMAAEYETTYAQMMRNNAVAFGLVLKPGAHNLCSTRFFSSKAGLKGNGGNNNEAVLATALNNMTGGAFSAEFTGPVLNYNAEAEPYLVGTYVTPEGDQRPLSEFGLLQALVYGNSRREAIRYWIDSQSSNMSLHQSIAYKMKCLNALGISYKIEEIYTMVPINTEVLAFLANKISGQGLITSSNLSSFVNNQGNGWGANRMSASIGGFYGIQQQNQQHGFPGGMQVVQTPQGMMMVNAQGQLIPFNAPQQPQQQSAPAPTKARRK